MSFSDVSTDLSTRALSQLATLSRDFRNKLGPELERRRQLRGRVYGKLKEGLNRSDTQTKLQARLPTLQGRWTHKELASAAYRIFKMVVNTNQEYSRSHIQNADMYSVTSTIDEKLTKPLTFIDLVALKPYFERYCEAETALAFKQWLELLNETLTSTEKSLRPSHFELAPKLVLFDMIDFFKYQLEVRA